MTIQGEQIRAYIEIVKLVADAIKQAGHIPSGHLYAGLMGVLSLEQYENIIRRLKNAGIITEKSYELFWNK